MNRTCQFIWIFIAIVLSTNAFAQQASDNDFLLKANAKGNNVNLESSWDKDSSTAFLSFENNPEGIKISIEW